MDQIWPFLSFWDPERGGGGEGDDVCPPLDPPLIPVLNIIYYAQ